MRRLVLWLALLVAGALLAAFAMYSALVAVVYYTLVALSGG